MSTVGAVQLAGWHRDLGEHAVSGSLYALPSTARLEGARLLHEAGCRVHVDVIVGPEGHEGVTWSELYAVRDLLPGARVDLHLIVLHDEPCRDETDAVSAAHDLALASLAVGANLIGRHRTALAGMRASGVALYEQVAPDASGPLEPPAGIDGALVMLVPPGTRQAADVRLLPRVETLARTLPVAVDGGVTPEIARRCLRDGAGFVVSGRSLLSYAPGSVRPTAPPTTAPPTTSTTPTTERRSA